MMLLLLVDDGMATDHQQPSSKDALNGSAKVSITARRRLAEQQSIRRGKKRRNSLGANGPIFKDDQGALIHVAHTTPAPFLPHHITSQEAIG